MEPAEGISIQEALNKSIERRKTFQTQQEMISLRRDLERYMVGLTAEVAKVGREIEQKAHSYAEYSDFINRIQDLRLTLLTTFAKWHKDSGSVEDGAVGKSVAALELSAGSLIADLKTKRYEIPAVSVQNGPDVRPKAANITKAPTETVIQRRTHSEPPLAEPEASTSSLPRRAGTSDYGQRLAAMVPREGG